MRVKQRRKNNKGFSLVEVIIAVAVLAAVTVPIMSMFTTVAKMNARAKTLQRATDLGQNIMEGLRGYTMEEVAELCVSADGKVDFSALVSGLDYMPSGYEAVSYSNDFVGTVASKVNGSEQDTNGVYGDIKNMSEFSGTKEKAYYEVGDKTFGFALCGIEYDSAVFDAVITYSVYREEEKTSGSGATESDSKSENKEYFLYNVEVSVYSANGERFSESSRLTTFESAVQNKK